MIRVTRQNDYYPSGVVERYERLHALGLCWPPFHCTGYSSARARGFGLPAGPYGPREAEIEATLNYAATPTHGADPVVSFLLRTYGPPGASCGS